MVELLHTLGKILGKLLAKSTLAQFIKTKLEVFYVSYEKYFPATFFAGGFGFDVATLGRIDHWVTLLQQSVFLLLIGSLLTFEARYNVKDLPYPEWFQKHKAYYESFMHFLFGGLFSAYTIFYFKSSSLMNSFVFFLLLVGLLIANEHSKVRKQGLPIKFLLFSLCVASFYVYFVPILWGSVGLVPFTISMCLSLLTLALFLKAITLKVHVTFGRAKHLLIPAIAIQLIFSSLYCIGTLPPVPLSVQYMGIFHDITKEKGVFYLHHEKPWWRFWHHGDQEFYARKGDRIYGFARIFSPTGFSDQVFVRWLYKNKKNRWSTSDRIPIEISGGRQKGFRGYTYKSNYAPGHWQMRVETSDGRELGRITFQIFESKKEAPRIYKLIAES